MTVRIGYVLKQYPRLSETFILNEILGLESHGVEVAVHSLRPATEGRFHPALAEVSAPVHYVSTSVDRVNFLESMQRVATIDAPGLQAALQFLDRLPAERRSRLLLQSIELAAHAHQQGVDHLHSHFLTVAAHTCHVAHLMTGISYSVTAHAKDIYRNTIDWELARTVAESSAGIVTVCDANARHLANRLGATDLYRIYNGIGPQQPPVTASARPDDHLLAVGRLVPKKGFDVMLDAVAALLPHRPNLRATIVGDGELRSELQSRSRSLGLEQIVTFAGSCTQDVVANLMRHATVLVAPCVVGPDGNQDALPTVLIEALAAGLPVVTTDVAGIPEIIDDGVHGRIVKPDAEAVAGAIQDLLSDQPLWASMSSAGPIRFRDRFDRAETTRELADLFGRLARVRVPG